MAFVAQCPFCKVRARLPDRARGAIGQCPRCGSSYTLASADDQRVPESVAAAEAYSDSDIEPVPASAVTTAIAVAAAAADRAAVESLPSPESDNPPGAARSRLRREAVAGVIALLLGASALLCASLSFLCGS